MLHTGTGFESKIKVQQVIENQVPSFILDESPNTIKIFREILYFSRTSGWSIRYCRKS